MKVDSCIFMNRFGRGHVICWANIYTEGHMRYLPHISVYLTDIVEVVFQDNNNPIILCAVSLYAAELLLRDQLWHKQDNAVTQYWRCRVMLR